MFRECIFIYNMSYSSFFLYEFKPVKLRLKIDLVSYPTRAVGLVNMDKGVIILFWLVKNRKKSQNFFENIIFLWKENIIFLWKEK